MLFVREVIHVAGAEAVYLPDVRPGHDTSCFGQTLERDLRELGLSNEPKLRAAAWHLRTRVKERKNRRLVSEIAHALIKCLGFVGQAFG